MSVSPPKDPETDQAAEMRRKAEARLQAREGDPGSPRSETAARALVHELQVHRIELELQNEELQRARTEAQEALERYHDLFDFAPVGYFLLEKDGRIREINLAGAALVGLDRSRASKHRFGQFVATEDRPAFADFLQQVLASEAKQTCQIKLIGVESLVPVLVEGIATHESPSQPTLCRAAVIDLTQQKRVDDLAAANARLKATEQWLRASEEQMRLAKEAAERANRAKDQFLAALSHELRTPLTPVVMGVSMLQDRHDLDASVRETLDMVRRNVEMEARLIDDLLDVARIARGTIVLNRRPIPLCAVIERAIDVCKADIEARDLDLQMDLQQCGAFWVDADAGRLQQVFWNLLKNATKFTPHGGRVSVRCRPNQDHVIVEVEDNGVGIEPHALSRVFDAFEQAHGSASQQFGGLGLGLAISKALVELHGGQIWAESEGANQGTTFRVRLPLCAPADRAATPASASSGKRSMRPLRILLVEDHPVTAKMMEKLLSDAGHTVQWAGDVAAGLKLAEQQSFDLLLSDLGLPDGSGHDLIRELHLRGHKFPGIALSGYGQEEDIQRSHEAGFAAHLTKPASREAVVDAVAAVTTGNYERQQ